MAAMIGPDGKPPTFNGAAWLSKDGRYWWNGTTWQPMKRRGFQPPIAMTLIVLVVVAGVWYLMTHVPKSAPEPYGVTNARIDSSTEIEFDYRRSTTCNDLTFNYTFFDHSGHQVDIFAGEEHHKVPPDTTEHYDVIGYTSIDSHAVRFDAVPTCHA